MPSVKGCSSVLKAVGAAHSTAVRAGRTAWGTAHSAAVLLGLRCAWYLSGNHLVEVRVGSSVHPEVLISSQIMLILLVHGLPLAAGLVFQARFLTQLLAFVKHLLRTIPRAFAYIASLNPHRNG